MHKKKFASLLFVYLLIFVTTVVAFQTLQSKIENAEAPEETVGTPDLGYSIITSNYSGVHYDLYKPSNFSGSLVILAGGTLGDKRYLSGWAETLAEAGYASLAFSTPPEGLQQVPRYVNNCRENIQTLLPFVFDASVFPISIDENSVSLVGMSGGGATVLSVNDTRIKATVSVCPYYVYDSCADNTCPVLIITGANDEICPTDTHGQIYYDELEQDKMIIEQVEVGHDIHPVGWEHLIAWLDYFTKDDYSVYSIITSVDDHAGILRSLSEFSDMPSL
jgi:dienelactone hydrolase